MTDTLLEGLAELEALHKELDDLKSIPSGVHFSTSSIERKIVESSRRLLAEHRQLIERVEVLEGEKTALIEAFNEVSYVELGGGRYNSFRESVDWGDHISDRARKALGADS